MALSLRFGAVSDIGRSRRKNDDSGYAGPYFLAVADGMGGAPAGDLASAVTVQTLRRLDTAPPDDLLEALAGAIHRANDRLAELIDDDPSVEGMGTTVTAALFDGRRIGVAHLGDSRGYLFRDGQLRRISADHSWVQSLIDEGRITEDEAAVHSHRSLLLKVLDGRHDNDPDLTLYDVRPGDRILLCSDGLSGFVDQERIERVMAVGAASSVATELTQIALEAGSTDNVTVIVGDVVDEPADDSAPLVVGAAADQHRGPLNRLRTWAQRDESTSGEMLMADSGVDPEELRYAPREPRRHLWVRRTAALVLVLALLAAAGLLSYGWTQNQYYVAAHDGRVAIYRGVKADVPGISLSHVYEDQKLLLSQLPSFRRSQVLDGVTAGGSLDKARRIVAQLRTFARSCARQASTPPTSTPTPKPPGPSRTGSTTSSSRPHRSGSTTPAGRTHGTAGPTVVTSPPQTNPPSAPTGSTPEECAGATPKTGSPR